MTLLTMSSWSTRSRFSGPPALCGSLSRYVLILAPAWVRQCCSSTTSFRRDVLSMLTVMTATTQTKRELSTPAWCCAEAMWTCLLWWQIWDQSCLPRETMPRPPPTLLKLLSSLHFFPCACASADVHLCCDCQSKRTIVLLLVSWLFIFEKEAQIQAP